MRPKELARRIAAGERVFLLDVRNRWEVETVTLPGGVLVPLPELRERLDEVEPPEGALRVAYCHHGVRSRSAAIMLEQAGLGEWWSLAGGIDAWSVEVDAKLKRY